MRRLNVPLALAIALGLAGAGAALAQDRARTKEVVIGLGAEPRTMLAVTIVDWTTNTQLEHIYDRLLDRDPRTLKPKPMLATGWKIVNDTTWEFTLRQGVRFHNGEAFNADSVKATMEYLQNPANKSHYAAYWKLVKEVQVVDDHTVRLDREAVAEPHRPRVAHRLPRATRQGAPRARPGEARREADRHGAVQVRRVEARRAARPREEPRLLAGARGREPRDLP